MVWDDTNLLVLFKMLTFFCHLRQPKPVVRVLVHGRNTLVFPLSIFLRYCYSWYVKLAITLFPFAKCDFMGSFILNLKKPGIYSHLRKDNKSFLGSDIGEFVVTIFFIAPYFKLGTSS